MKRHFIQPARHERGVDEDRRTETDECCSRNVAAIGKCSQPPSDELPSGVIDVFPINLKQGQPDAHLFRWARN